MITFNYRGYPPSSVPADGSAYAHEILVADALALLGQIDGGRAYLVGHGTGGNLALSLALSAPERIKGLVLAGSGAGRGDSDWKKNSLSLSEKIRAEGIAALSQSVASAPQRQPFADKDPLGWRDFIGKIDAFDADGLANLVACGIALRPTFLDLAPEIAGLRIPVLVVFGDRDYPAFEPSLLVARTAPYAGLSVIPYCGHSIIMEEAAEFNRIVVDFLARVRPGTVGRMAAAMNHLNTLSATEAAALIRKGELSSVELVSACLDRIEEFDARTGAWAFVDPHHALDQARKADQATATGALHGVPVGLKDIIDTADMPTEYGSSLYRGHRPGHDAACVSLLRAAGAVILGKTVTTEFGFRHPGKTVNPHNPLHTPGGSSSGSAAAVADGMVPLAVGAQTAGSVIRPAAYCGVIGFKPSYGMASYSGIRHLAESFDTLGWMARYLDDVALCRQVLCGENRPPREWETGDRPRLVLCRTPYWEQAELQTQSLVEHVAAASGTGVDEISLPVDGDQLLEANWTITKFEAARRLLGSHGRSCRQSKAIEQPLSSNRLIAWHSEFRLCEGNQTHDGNPVGPELANPAGSIGPKKPANVIGCQSAYLSKVSNDVATKTE